jgi:hypothetical protein
MTILMNPRRPSGDAAISLAMARRMPRAPAGVNAATRDPCYDPLTMKYVEEKTFTVRLELRCEFPDDYQGEEDGYQWAEAIAPLAAEVVRAAADAARRRGWSVRTGNRGRPSDEEVTLIAERTASS